ncbi:DUF2147 domain-containing protein [Palleronia caenipelagi]|uniref:DUF2147 domain-containing protein n=2 Tax=Palleronia caenipelagi TaxID=2489174 RepID=A0A547PS69_9RHOB|nr:DUF2147 domain-containing protein [Palleronia caenipelagi]TRD16988.1 DUF2147 domain-containing protein [Palleronia caenipelagi]
MFAACAGAAAADPIEGVWQTQPDEGAYAHVTVAPCGGAFCGTITRTFNASGEYASPNKGKQIVRSMTAQGGGKYTGNVWRPANNKVYAGKAEISGKQMKLSGCVAGGLICKAQTWVKIR